VRFCVRVFFQLKSGTSSRADHRSEVRSRAHLTATPHSANKRTSSQSKPLTEEDLETVLDFSGKITVHVQSHCNS
jgi:hypothetical protein